MNNVNLQLIVFIVLLLTPISYLFLLLIEKIKETFYRYSHESNSIISSLYGTFISEELNVKSIIYENFTSLVPHQGLLKIQNLNTKEEILAKQKNLSKEKTFQRLAIITTLCHFPHVKYLENRILRFIKDCRIDILNIKKKYQIISTISHKQNKKLTSIVAKNKENNKIYAFAKGHPQDLLKLCTRIEINGKKIELTAQKKENLLKLVKEMIDRGEKVICFAYKPLPIKQLHKYPPEFVESDLVFTALIGLEHPINYQLSPILNLANQNKIYCHVLTKEKVSITKSSFQKMEIAYEHLPHKNIDYPKLNKKLQENQKNLFLAEINSNLKNKIYENYDIIHHPKELEKSILRIIKLKHNHQNFKIILGHSLGFIACKLLILLSAIFFNLTIPFSISALIYLEIFSFLSQFLFLSLNSSKIVTLQKIPLLIQSILSGAIISGLYLYNHANFLISNSTFKLSKITQTPNPFIFTILTFALSTLILNQNKQNSFFLKPNLKNIMQNFLFMLLSFFFLFTVHLSLFNIPQLEKHTHHSIFILIFIIFLLTTQEIFLILKNDERH